MIGQSISEVVKEFAEKKGLFFNLWHKDAPLWVVTDLSWDESNMGSKGDTVEVGVFYTDTSVEILAIPDAYQMVGGKRNDLDPKERLDSVRNVSFSDFQKNVKHGEDLLREELKEAWRTSQELGHHLP